MTEKLHDKDKAAILDFAKELLNVEGVEVEIERRTIERIAIGPSGPYEYFDIDPSSSRLVIAVGKLRKLDV